MESDNKIFDQNKIREMSGTYPMPADLENKVLLKLKSINLLGGRKGKYLGLTLKLGYAFLLIFIGSLIGYTINNNGSIMTNTDQTSKYILLLYKNDSLAGTEQERVSNYAAWARKYGAQQKVIGGEKLESSGFILSSTGVSPKFEGKDVYDEPRTLSGFFVIQASNYDAALSIAKTCPHIKYGGKVELREITDLSKTKI